MKKDDVFYQAMLARDYRFDGKFFVGVKTTGIYCRPICPAKPKRENVEFFSSAHKAEHAGYRPCLRCRPEAAPLSPAWYGTSSVVQRALKIIANKGPILLSEDKFAEQFGVSARHLRRLFEEEIGQTPKQLSDITRLNFARKLLVETKLPIVTVAMTAGFASLRRFNDAFKKRFHKSPSQVRRKENSSANENGVTLSLSYRPPYDWETLLGYYRRHCIWGLEKVTETTYERIFRFDVTVGVLQVSVEPEKSSLLVQIHCSDVKCLLPVIQKVRQMFDLDSDPLLIANSFSTDRHLDQLWKKYPGLRIPKAWDSFEATITTVLGQLVSVEQATRLVGQLVKGYVEKVVQPLTEEEAYLFPTAEVLSKASLKEVSTTEKRKKTIREIAKLVHLEKLILSSEQDPEEFRKNLLAVPGIGPWSTEYTALRALGDTDSFPHTDLVLKKALDTYPKINLDDVRPWRSYVAFYLWKDFMANQASSKPQKKVKK